METTQRKVTWRSAGGPSAMDGRHASTEVFPWGTVRATIVLRSVRSTNHLPDVAAEPLPHYK